MCHDPRPPIMDSGPIAFAMSGNDDVEGQMNYQAKTAAASAAAVDVSRNDSSLSSPSAHAQAPRRTP